jgi:cyclopropane-fatty-acyl-phospholipid synthase
MSAVATMTDVAERLPLPDVVLRASIALLVGHTRRKLAGADANGEAAFAADMTRSPIALHTSAANEQHYELPPEFFAHILGPRRKYSSCLYEAADDSLADAEERALAETASHAQLADGQRILELGCGWGSLSLWMAQRYPAAQILVVSNALSQRQHIEAEAARCGFDNLRVVTADMNVFDTEMVFDRVVSVEMFEHMSNWPALLERIYRWLDPAGRVFLHVFSHRDTPYRFDHADRSDWIAQHFFTGGVMPSHGLIRRLKMPFQLEDDWRWSGVHYRRTAEDWLANYDRHAEPIDAILRDIYGADAALWRRRWRLFFLATAGLFGAHDGDTWGVSHYRLKPR